MSKDRGSTSGVALGKKSDAKKRFGHAVHKSGTHSEAEVAASKSSLTLNRPANEAPATLPKKRGE